MAEDAKLATHLKLARTAEKDRALYFSLVMKGGSDGALIVAKKKVPPKEIKAAKDRCGGAAVLSGRCYGEDGKVVFEMAKAPPGTMTKLLKTIITRDAAMTVNVLPRRAADVEAGEDEAAEDAGAEGTNGEAAPTAPPDLAAVAAAFQALQRSILVKAQTASEEVKAKIRLGMPRAQQLAGQQNYAGANLILNKLAELVEPVPTAPPTPEANGPATQLAAFRRRQKEVLAKAVRASAEVKAKVKLGMDRAVALVGEQKFDQADLILNKLDQLLGSTPAAPPPEPVAPTDAATTVTEGSAAEEEASQEEDETAEEEAGAEDAEAAEEADGIASERAETEAEEPSLAAAVAARFAELRPRYQRTVALCEEAELPRVQELTALWTRAQQLEAAGAFAQAQEVLDQLTPLLASVSRAAEAKLEILRAAGPGNVVFVKSKLAWDTARKTARSELRRFQQAVLADAETQADPRFPEIQRVISGLDRALNGFDDQLKNALDEVLAASGEQKRPLVQKAVQLVGRYRAELDGNAVLSRIDATPYGQVGVYATLAGTLEDLETKLIAQL